VSLDLCIDSQETPVEILELPACPDTRDLEDEDTVVGEEVVDFLEKLGVAADTDVLCHFETTDLVKVALGVRDIAVVHAENTTLVLGHAVLAETLGAERGLVFGESD
jgi:hypothetical protein